MEFLCKAQYVGTGEFVRCLEDLSTRCYFAEPMGSTYFCKSPLRTYLAEKLYGTTPSGLKIKATEEGRGEGCKVLQTFFNA